MFSIHTSHFTPIIKSGKEIISQITLDAMTHFTAAVIPSHMSGPNKETLYKQLSAISEENEIGGTCLVIIPKEDKSSFETHVSKFKPLMDTQFRQCDRVTLLKRTQDILDKYPDEKALLDKILTAGNSCKEFSSKSLLEFMGQNSTSNKTLDIKMENDTSIQARFSHSKVETFFLKDSQNKSIQGLVRLLNIAPGIAYFSDETVFQDIISFASFKGKDEAENRKIRQQFLLVYLFNQILQKNYRRNFIISINENVESIYEGLGFKKFTEYFTESYCVYARFSKPGELLLKAKEELINKVNKEKIHTAVMEQNLELLEECNRKKHSFTLSPLIYDLLDDTPSTNSLSFVMKLIQFGADVNMRSVDSVDIVDGVHPLMAAFCAHSLAVARVLIEAKAEIDTPLVKDKPSYGTGRIFLEAINKYVTQDDKSGLLELFKNEDKVSDEIKHFEIYKTPEERDILKKILSSLPPAPQTPHARLFPPAVPASSEAKITAKLGR